MQSPPLGSGSGSSSGCGVDDGAQQSPVRRLQSTVFASGGGFGGGSFGKFQQLKTEGSYPVAPRGDPPFELFGLEPFDSDLKPPPMA